MSQVPEFKDLEPVDQMIEVLMAAGPFAYGKEARLQQTAEEWLAENFDLETAFAWLTVAGCFDAATAAKLSAAGISPDEMAEPTGPTLGYRVAAGAVSVDEAVAIVKQSRKVSPYDHEL